MSRYSLLLTVLLVACSSSSTSVIVELSASAALQSARPPIEVFTGSGHREALPNTAQYSGFLAPEPIRLTLTPEDDELEFTVLVEVGEIPPLEMRIHGRYTNDEAHIVRVRITNDCTRGECAYDSSDLTYCPADNSACPVTGGEEGGETTTDAGPDAP